MRRILPVFFAVLFAGFPAGAARADQEPVVIRGDQVEYLDGMKKVVAAGRVEAVYRDVKLTCDHATLYMETKDAYLKGHVRLVQLNGLLKGEEVLYNFETRKGTILKSEGEVGPWRTRADRAEKISADSFVQRDGSLTSCDFEQPHTRMQAREVQVFMDDKVVLKSVLMYLGSVPMMYVPSYTHLLDDKRPRVTLTPGKSKDWGLFLLTSWRVYLHENLQGKLHIDYREQKDLATGFDLKYHVPGGGDGIFREYYTNQRQLHNDHFYTRYTNPDDVQPTTEQERYRIQERHIWNPDDSTSVTLEYNYQSDPTVVLDFFEREQEEDTPNPQSFFQVIKTSPWYGFTFLTKKRVNRRWETATEQLPFISFDIRPLDLNWLPNFNRWLYPSVSLDLSRRYGWFYKSSYTYERSDVADVRNGTENGLSMFDTVQELFYPMHLFRWLNFRPFFQFRETAFSRGAVNMSSQFRQSAATGFDMSGKFFRVFPLETDLWGLDIHRLRHVITPTLTYLYQATPTIAAGDLVRQGLAKSNVLTPGIEQKFQTKRKTTAGEQTVDLGRFGTQFPYDVEGPSGRGGEWQNLTIDAELLPYRWMRIESDAAVDPHIGKFETINADFVAYPSLTYGAWGGRTISEVVNAQTGEVAQLPWAVGLGWRYHRNTSAQLTVETEFNLGKKWRIGAYDAFDVKRFATETSNTGSRTVKKIYDLSEFEYRLQRDLHEWTGELIYNVQRGHGDTLLLVFRLKAAPDLPFEFERNYHRPKAGRNFTLGRLA